MIYGFTPKTRHKNAQLHRKPYQIAHKVPPISGKTQFNRQFLAPNQARTARSRLENGIYPQKSKFLAYSKRFS
jgi:hypothetical protein